MALETLKGVKNIGDFEIYNADNLDNLTEEELEIELVKADNFYIRINHETNTIVYQLQNKPVREVGVNGCQVETIIESALLMVQGLNKKYPCRENALIATKLEEALLWSKRRTENRIARQVEGTNAI